MSNRLATASSPYLRQHADNPVDWYEWGDDAFARARQRDVPVLLSIGYSSCHWCHVMAHESFSDPGTAAEMNQLFVNIKVDREERPDIDHIYMTALQALTGHGGWPLTAWLTHDQRPFYAGTYFPPTDRPGHPSFRRVMAYVNQIWTEQREKVLQQGKQLQTLIGQSLSTGSEDLPDSNWSTKAGDTLQQRFDPEYGGFGTAPKFPQQPVLGWLLDNLCTQTQPGQVTYPEMLRTTLRWIDRGGFHDQVGGGFARYAVDRAWTVPHFEKMLYDNAQLAGLYARAGLELGEPRFLTVAELIVEYLERDLSHPGGGFYAAEDADSEGEEGKFYLWSWEELGDTVGDDRELVADFMGASPAGNFEGSNLLQRSRPVEQVAEEQEVGVHEVWSRWEAVRTKLLEKRSGRIRPMRDEKIITGWNGLAIRSLSEVGRVTGDSRYLDSAERTARFLLEEVTSDEILWRSLSGGKLGASGFLEDYGAVAMGFFSLYAATGNPEWFGHAERLTRSIPVRFAAPDGGFYTTSDQHEQLIVRPQDWLDNPLPSGNSLALEALATLFYYTGDSWLYEQVQRGLQAAAQLIEQYPLGVGHLLRVLKRWENPPLEVAVVGPEAGSWVRELCMISGLVDHVVAWDSSSGSATSPVPLLEDRHPSPTTRAYVCSGMVCQEPTTTFDVLLRQLRTVKT